jgi:2-oxoglutarate dehydrogenase E2 component (dihydrolipoamide succinyltransferase)
MSEGRIEKLSYSERWLRDGLSAVDPPGAILSLEVDMSNAVAVRQRMQGSGTPVTFTHLIVHAAAAALTAHPELHRLVAGNKRLFPNSVDICLSVSGEGVVTPVLIIENAGSKSLAEIASRIREGAGEAREQDRKMNDALRRWGWVVPLSILRRALIRFLLNRLWYRRRASGTFQISVVSIVDLNAPLLFNTAGALGVGRVRNRAVPVGDKIEIRPTVMLTCCLDHKVWNGMDAATFLNSVKDNLERGPLLVP